MDSEYHRRRAEMEMERALHAKRPDEAMLHLELARIHRQKRDRLSIDWRSSSLGGWPAICRTDKES